MTRAVPANGIELAVVDEGDGPLVVLCHGFPELAFSWRHQIPALVRAGYRVLAPDMRGFGASTAPAEVEAYDVVTLCEDMCGLLDAVGEQAAIFVGHDWGANVVWQLARAAPRARARGGRAERAVRPARTGAADPDHAQALGRGLLHRVVPGAGRRRRGPRERRAPDADDQAPVDGAVGPGG